MTGSPLRSGLRHRRLTGVLVLILAGCSTGSDGPSRYAVDGEVTYAGNPVPAGEILFEPDAAQGNRGPVSSAIIQDSKFSIPADRGTVGGPYIVRITGRAASTGAGQDDVDPGRDLFSEFIDRRELPLEPSRQIFEVPGDPSRR